MMAYAGLWARHDTVWIEQAYALAVGVAHQRLGAARSEALPAQHLGAIWLPTPRFAIRDGYVRGLELLGALDLAHRNRSLGTWQEPPEPLLELLAGDRHYERPPSTYERWVTIAVALRDYLGPWWELDEVVPHEHAFPQAAVVAADGSFLAIVLEMAGLEGVTADRPLRAVEAHELLWLHRPRLDFELDSLGIPPEEATLGGPVHQDLLTLARRLLGADPGGPLSCYMAEQVLKLWDWVSDLDSALMCLLGMHVNLEGPLRHPDLEPSLEQAVCVREVLRGHAQQLVDYLASEAGQRMLIGPPHT
jgi:hypothetical protein